MLLLVLWESSLYLTQSSGSVSIVLSDHTTGQNGHICMAFWLRFWSLNFDQVILASLFPNYPLLQVHILFPKNLWIMCRGPAVSLHVGMAAWLSLDIMMSQVYNPWNCCQNQSIYYLLAVVVIAFVWCGKLKIFNSLSLVV